MIEPISGTLAYNALKDTYKKVHSLIKGKYDESKHNEAIENGLKNLTASIEKFIQVKTIYKGNQLVDLNSFYIPTKLLINYSRVKVNQIIDIDNKNVILEGTVGQGKSILMRYLAYKEATIGNRIPIFFELRNLGKDTIKQALIETISSWIPELNETDFDKLLKTGNFCILLDGFDEIPQNDINTVIKDIGLLINQYPSTQIIISSRPDFGIQKSNNFHVYKLAPYTIDEQFQLVKKLVENEEDVEILKKSIRESDNEIKDLLRTPLMITLYIMKYNFEFKAPKNQVEFYRDLFPLLISRHDKTKAGFTRKFSSNLNEAQLQDCFEAFCFYSANAKKLVFTNAEVLEFLKKSLTKVNLSDNPYNVLEDICKVVCLLLNEGFDYSFIHKSIQEYYYASFIADKPSTVKSDFFKKVKDNYLDSHFLINTIKFLSIMDTYSYYKYYKYPIYKEFVEEFEIKENQNNLISKAYFIIQNKEKKHWDIYFRSDNNFDNPLYSSFRLLSEFIFQAVIRVANLNDLNGPSPSFSYSVGAYDLEGFNKLDTVFTETQLSEVRLKSIEIGKEILAEIDEMNKFIESKEKIVFEL